MEQYVTNHNFVVVVVNMKKIESSLACRFFIRDMLEKYFFCHVEMLGCDAL